MKAYIVLGVLLMFSVTASAQPAGITYSATDQPLSRIFEDLSENYRIKFAFDAEVFGKIRTSVSFRNASPENIMAWFSEKHSLEFRLLEGTWVVIQKKITPEEPVNPDVAAAVPVVKKYQVSGYISDQTTGEPLYYCAIVLPGNKGTVTNELGFFYFETLSDSVPFFITHLGYQRLDTVISVKNTQPVRITLKPFVMVMEEVDVVRKETNTIEMPRYADRVGFNSAQSANMPRLANDDLVNMLTLIPGIGFLPGSTGGLTIRGSNPSENLILLDGIPLLETGHLFGNVSALNAGFIRQAFVSRGGFDTRFGDKASGLIELTGKSGSKSTPSLEASFNLLNGDVLATVPLGKKFSVSGAYRRSYMDFWPNYLFRKLLTESRLTNITDESVTLLPIVRYQDMNLKATLTPSENHEISLSLIRSDDQQMLDYNTGTTRLLYRNEWVRSKNTGIGGTWLFQKGNWHHQLTSGYTLLHHYQEQESGEEITNPSEPSVSQGRGKKLGLLRRLKEENPNRNSYSFDTDSNSVREFRVQYSAEWKKGNFIHQLGLGYTDNDYHFRIWSDNSEKNIPTDSLVSSANQRIGHAFLQQTYQPADLLKIRWGLRANRDQLTAKFYLQPRGGIELMPSEALKCYYQGGLYHQFLSKIPLIDLNRNVDLVWFLPDDTGKGILKSVHHIAGLQWTTGGFLFNAEYYLKSTSGKQWLYAETYKVKDLTRVRYVTHSGMEQNQGVDVFVQFRHPHFSHQAGYSFASGKEKMEGINSYNWFPSLNNHRHQIQLAEMFSLKGWVASVIWNYRSGQPRILPSASASTLVFDRLDYFSQLDASVAKTLLFKHAGITAGVSFLNMLNRLNVVQVDYLQISAETSTYNITSNVSSLSFTPVFFLKCRIF